jgi:hypothetical protein
MGEPAVVLPLTMAHNMCPQSLKTPRAGFEKVKRVCFRRKLKNNGAEKQHILLVHGLYWHIGGWVHFNIKMYII